VYDTSSGSSGTSHDEYDDIGSPARGGGEYCWKSFGDLEPRRDSSKMECGRRGTTTASSSSSSSGVAAAADDALAAAAAAAASTTSGFFNAATRCGP
jgi:hypothetical protein